MTTSTGKLSSNEKLNKSISSGSEDVKCFKSELRSLMKVELASALSPEQLKNSEKTFSGGRFSMFSESSGSSSSSKSTRNEC